MKKTDSRAKISESLLGVWVQTLEQPVMGPEPRTSTNTRPAQRVLLLAPGAKILVQQLDHMSP